MNASLTCDAPASIEQYLLDLLRSLLGVDTLMSDDNLLDAGMNSLLVALVCSQIQADLGAQIAAVSVYQNPSVRSLTSTLDELLRATAQSTDKAGEPLTGWSL